MKPIIWDPEKSDNLIETIETILELVETGELDPSSMRPVDLRNMAKVTEDTRLDRLANFFKKKRNSWATGDGDWLPNTEEDKTGWTGFVEKTLPYWSSNGTNFQSTKLNRDHYRHTKKEIGDIKTARDLYLSGECTAEEARELIPGIDLTDSQMNIYFPKQTATEKKEEEIEKEVKEIEKKHEKGIDIEQRVTILEKKYNDTHKTTSLRKVKRKNPYFLLGDIYQNFLGAALRVAHLEDRIYEEVALSYEEENGKLTITSNIVDYLALIGRTPSKKTIKEEETMILYEIKLGRQRVGLKEQVERQIKAAKETGYKNVECRLIMGSMFSMPDELDKDFNPIISWKNGRINKEKLLKEVDSSNDYDKQRINLVVAENEDVIEIFKDNPEVKITDPSEIFMEGGQILNKKIKWMKNDLETAQHRFTDFLRHYKKGITPNNEKDISDLINKSSDIVKQSSIIKNQIEGVANQCFKGTYGLINADLQLRTLSLEELTFYDDNIYLLNRYIPKFRKKMRDSLLKNYSKGEITGKKIIGNNPFNYLNTILTKIREKEINEDNKLEIWAEYFGGKDKVENILKNRNRNNIQYIKEGPTSEFLSGTRVIPKKNSKYVNILNELENLGIDTSYINFNNEKQVKHFEENLLPNYLTLLEEEYDKMELFNKGSIESQRRKIKSNKEDLESIVSVKGFSKKTNSGLNHYQHWLDQAGLEGNLMNMEQVSLQVKKDHKERRVAKIKMVFLGMKNKIYDILNLPTNKQVTPREYLIIENIETLQSLRQVIGTSTTEEQARLTKISDVLGVFNSHLFRKEKRKEKQEKFRAINQIYNQILQNSNSYDTIDKIEKELVTYLEDTKQERIIDQRNYEITSDLKQDKKALSVMRSYRFRNTNLLENYWAASLLHVIDKTRVIRDFDTNIGQDYFNLARQELKTGKDYGSASLLKETIDYMNELSSSPEKIMDHYLNDNKKETK